MKKRLQKSDLKKLKTGDKILVDVGCGKTEWKTHIFLCEYEGEIIVTSTLVLYPKSFHFNECSLDFDGE